MKVENLELERAESKNANPLTPSVLTRLADLGKVLASIVAIVSIVLAVAGYRTDLQRDHERRFTEIVASLTPVGRNFPSEMVAITGLGELRARFLDEDHAFGVAFTSMIYVAQTTSELRWLRETASDTLIGAIDLLHDSREVEIIRGKWEELTGMVVPGEAASDVAAVYQRVSTALERAESRVR